MHPAPPTPYQLFYYSYIVTHPAPTPPHKENTMNKINRSVAHSGSPPPTKHLNLAGKLNNPTIGCHSFGGKAPSVGPRNQTSPWFIDRRASINWINPSFASRTSCVS